MEWLSEPQAWIALGTLTILEIVLGIDNIVFISVLTGRLPKAERPRARKVGLGLALIMRLVLLSMLSWIMGLTEPWFSVFGKDFAGRELILLACSCWARAPPKFIMPWKARMMRSKAAARLYL